MLSVRRPTNHADSSPVGGPGGEWLSCHHSHVAKKGPDKGGHANPGDCWGRGGGSKQLIPACCVMG